MEEIKDLGVSVSEGVKAIDKFGRDRMEQQLKGSAGTLHATDKETLSAICESAWQLSEATQLPVVVVVRAPRKVI